MKEFLKLSFFLFQVVLISALPEQKITVHLAAAKLPTPRDGFASFYDGDDTVYLFGDGYTSTTDIIKYTISTDNVTILTSSPFRSRAVGTFSGPNEALIYVAAQASSEEISGGYIYTFNPATLATEVLLGPGIFFMENRLVVQTSNDFVYFFGGFQFGRELITMNLNTLNFTRDPLGLPVHFWTPAGLSDGNGNVLVFGNNTEYVGDQLVRVLKYNIASGNRTLTGLPVELTFATDTPTPFSVQDKNGHIWLIGTEGFRLGKESILQYDPVNEKFKAWNVQWAEGVNDAGLSSPTGVYVEKLNRIYVFGGEFESYEFPRERDDIWYINLDDVQY